MFFLSCFFTFFVGVVYSYCSCDCRFLTRHERFSYIYCCFSFFRYVLLLVVLWLFLQLHVNCIFLFSSVPPRLFEPNNVDYWMAVNNYAAALITVCVFICKLPFSDKNIGRWSLVYSIVLKPFEPLLFCQVLAPIGY